MQLKAVITGDIVRSRDLPADLNEAMLLRLKKFLDKQSKTFEMKTEIFRGDSFQCLLESPEFALRAALCIKTYIRSLNPSELYDIKKKNKPEEQEKQIAYTNFLFDARISIGIGEANISAGSIAISNGPAFIHSGTALDEIKNTKRTFVISSDDEFDEELYTESILLDAILSKTSALQCQVILRKLFDNTEIEIARQLKIQQPAVNQRSNAGNWSAISAMVDRFETIYEYE